MFGKTIPGVLADSGFQSFTLDVLETFCSGLKEVFQNLLQPPPSLTGEIYEIIARVLLGFQVVIIFGVKAITPSITQAVVYIPFYIDKAIADGKAVGPVLSITLEHISDATMETAHKNPNEEDIMFSGGRHGAADVIEYQQCVLTQVFQNEVYRIWDKGNQVKRKRPRESNYENEQKRRKVQVASYPHRYISIHVWDVFVQPT